MSGPAGHSLTGAIARAWVHPRAAMARQVEEGLSEPRALFHLMLASGLLFVASLPAAVASARRLTVEDPVSGTVAAHIFGYFFVAPLLAYGVAALAHLCVRAFGGRAPFLAARSALFWSVLVVAPAVLAVTALEALALPRLGGAALPLVRVLGYLGLGLCGQPCRGGGPAGDLAGRARGRACTRRPCRGAGNPGVLRIRQRPGVTGRPGSETECGDRQAPCGQSS